MLYIKINFVGKKVLITFPKYELIKKILYGIIFGLDVGSRVYT